MNEQCFPPSPNWYLSNVLTCISNDVVAYGSRGNIVILHRKDSGGPRISITAAHKDRVTSVVHSTCKASEDKLYDCVVSTGDDSYVRLWDLNTMTPLQAHIAHGENQKVIGLDWSPADFTCVVSIDESSSIISWDLHKNSTARIYVGKLHPTCLACCPHNKDLIAIGTKPGLVCVVNIKGNGKVYYRLRGHDSEIVSLSWCPVKNNVFLEGDGPEDLLLASGSKHRSVYIWRAGRDGRYEAVLNVPSQPVGLRKRPGGVEGNWVSLYWRSPYQLLAGTHSGSLVSWDLRNKAQGGAGDAGKESLCRVLHSSHGRVAYCISGHPDNSVVWSISQDRQLVAFDLESSKVVALYPTIGGIVYCITPSPIDPNRIAFGSGDAVVRVWDLSNPNPFQVNCLWQNVKGKVTSLAWHPTKENCLAFGTAEGRVGLFDVSSSKAPLIFRPYHCHSVYTLCWGPPLCIQEVEEENQDIKYTLYSCGDGSIVQYNHNKPEKEPKNIKELDVFRTTGKKEGRCDLAWKVDNTLLAIGNEDGTVQVFTIQPLKLVCTLHAHKKLIQKLAWHPEGTATDTGYSPYLDWLAIASKDSVIKVYNIRHGDAESEHVATLTGHVSGVLSLCWSPHISGQLVSVSYDQSAQVWDVPKQLPLGNYNLHAGIVYSCAWSSLNPDLIMTGSADFTLRVWKISSLTNKLPVDKKKQKKIEHKNLKLVEVASDLPGGNEETVPIKSSLQVVNSVELLAVSEKELVLKKKSGKNRSYFPVSSKPWTQGRQSNLKRCRSILKGEDSSGPSFFKDRSALLELLEQEEQYHTEAGNVEYVQHMTLWKKGNLGDILKEAANRNELSDWLVSLAPMVSLRLWQDTCVAYAKQLSSSCNYHKAASYLLACHKVDEAIDLLTSNKLFREAISIAKSRLSPDDPSIDRILKDWVRQLEADGNYEVAAECLISCGQLEAAAELLARRDDEACLLLAVDLAKRVGKSDMASHMAVRCIHTSLLNKNWEVASQLLDENKEFKHCAVLVCVHKLLVEGEKTQPLLSMIAEGLEESYTEDLGETYSLLEKTIEKAPAHDNLAKLWLSLSGEVALSFCCTSTVSRLRHLVAAASLCYEYQVLRPNTNPLHHFLSWLGPGDPLAEGSIFKKVPGSNEEADLLRSLRCYLYAGLFRHFQDKIMVDGCAEEEREDWSAIAVGLCREYIADMEGDVDSMLFYRDQLEIKNCKQEIATAAAKERLQSEPVDLQQARQKLEQLTKRKESFEKQRHSTPNPFITFCLFKSVCTFLIEEMDRTSVVEVLQQGEECWRKLEAMISEM